MNKRWLITLYCIVVMMMTLKAGIVAAAPSGQLSDDERKYKLKELARITEQVYLEMQQGNAPSALQNMDKLIHTVEGLSYKGLTSVEGIHALAESIMDAKQSLVSVKPDLVSMANTSAKLHLAVNSLTERDRALWLQYYKVMADDLMKMNQARTNGSKSQFLQQYRSLRQHYETIRPAAVISRDASEISRFDSWMSYVEGLAQASSWDEQAIKSAMQHSDALLKQLFGRKIDEPVFLPVVGYTSPWYWTMLIGSWIMLALLYTGYRKYRASVNDIHVMPLLENLHHEHHEHR